ncbi:hypothetical protein DFH06DRAFT_1294276 [Mycena polygramma]|nr:hypothetical protein DFH06DRAFT_1294274 [Mycena polygramma]KAJ7669527.1 hypothetical protein DFH06DRAFT_1294276 [Mycena polygramma]
MSREPCAMAGKSPPTTAMQRSTRSHSTYGVFFGRRQANLHLRPQCSVVDIPIPLVACSSCPGGAAQRRRRRRDHISASRQRDFNVIFFAAGRQSPAYDRNAACPRAGKCWCSRAPLRGADVDVGWEKGARLGLLLGCSEAPKPKFDFWPSRERGFAIRVQLACSAQHFLAKKVGLRREVSTRFQQVFNTTISSDSRLQSLTLEPVILTSSPQKLTLEVDKSVVSSQ